MKYHIVGIHKCGTMSLMYYLRKHGHAIIGQGSLFKAPDGLTRHASHYSDAKVLIILRDPIERMWSHYNYARNENKDGWKMEADSFVDAINRYPELVEGSCYLHWLSRWAPYKPAVVHLEDMIKYPDFPKSNWTKIKGKMTLTERIYAMKKLQEREAAYLHSESAGSAAISSGNQ